MRKVTLKKGDVTTIHFDVALRNFNHGEVTIYVDEFIDRVFKVAECVLENILVIQVKK